MLFDITHTAYIINHLLLNRIIIKGIHGKIAALYIFINCSEFITYRPLRN